MGGVPTIGMLEDGKSARFKLEHVWVEAYVDYFPNRGALFALGGIALAALGGLVIAILLSALLSIFADIYF